MITHREEIRKNSFKLPKRNGRFYRPFSFFAFFKKLFEKVLTSRGHGVIMSTEIKGSGLPLEVK